MTELDEAGASDAAPVWTVFGDLMSGLLGAFVLILIGVLVTQMELVASLKSEVEKRRIEEQRRMALEHALAVPLAAGRITLNDGREIQSVDTPKYDDDTGFYEFEQLDGKRVRVNKDQVRTVKDL